MPVRNRRYRIAVFGLGWWGPKLLRNLTQHPLVEKVIGVDVSREICCRVGREMGCETSWEPIEVLADREIGAVVIATPPATHHSIATAAFEAGKHVLVTKPPTSTLEELQDLVRGAERVDKVFMMDTTFVYGEPVRRLRQLLDEGIMADIRFVQSLYPFSTLKPRRKRPLPTDRPSLCPWLLTIS